MTQLRPADIFVIQAAIEDYRRRYPDRPTPSAEVALAWRLDRKGRHKQPQQTKADGGPGLLRSILRGLSGLLRA
jgi:hypothetical protein